MAIVNFENMVSGDDLDTELLGKAKIGKRIKAKLKAAKKTVRGQIGLYKQRRKIRKSKGLTKAEKRAQLRTVSKKIRKGRRKIIKGVVKGMVGAPLMRISPTARTAMLAKTAAKRIKARKIAKRKAALRRPISKTIIPPAEPVIDENGKIIPMPGIQPQFEPMEPEYKEPVTSDVDETEDEQEVQEEPKKMNAAKMLLPLGAGLAALAFLLGEI